MKKSFINFLLPESTQNIANASKSFSGEGSWKAGSANCSKPVIFLLRPINIPHTNTDQDHNQIIPDNTNRHI